MKHELCKLADLPETGTRIVPFFGREVHVWRQGSRPRAAANACLHLGGPLGCKDGALVCAWHGARYDLATGEKLEGPGPEGARLMYLPVRAEGDALMYVWGE